jgi:hydrogenase assembly chaperone HypC/HupF
MCLAVPRKVIEVNGKEVIVECNGEKKKAMSLLDVGIGEYVIINSGIVVEKISEEEAKNALKINIMDSE